MLIIAAACSNGVEPASQVINVRVVDDRGVAVDRMPVTVSLTSVIQDTNTGRSGSVDIALPAAGEYTVHVVPRAGYLRGPDPLTRKVFVAPSGRVNVEFVVFRAGVSTGDPRPWENPGS